MTSCTKTSEDDVDPNAPVEIKLNAGIETSVSIGRSTVNNLDEATLGDFVFFKGDGDQTGTNLTWSYTPLTSTVSADGTITFTDVILNNPDATASSARNAYGHYMNWAMASQQYSLQLDDWTRSMQEGWYADMEDDAYPAIN